MAKIGFIGLGIMGAPMAGHLLDGGHEVTSCVHKTPAPDDLKKKGLKLAKTPKEVAAASEIVIIMVPDTPQVQSVLFGEGGVAEGLSKGRRSEEHTSELQSLMRISYAFFSCKKK